MNRSIAILSLLSFVGIIIASLLMMFGVINLLNNFKYLVVLSSIFLTLFSLGWFVHRQELPRLLFLLISLVLVLPFFIPLLGLVDSEYLTNLWKVFMGGSIFQIGTGIYALLGGFIKGGLNKSQVYASTLNYAIFLFLTSILIFDITALMNASIYIILGSIASVLSIILTVMRKPTLSLYNKFQNLQFAVSNKLIDKYQLLIFLRLYSHESFKCYCYWLKKQFLHERFLSHYQKTQNLRVVHFYV